MSAREDGLLHEQITRTIIGCFFEVYNKLGTGFLESVYAAAIEHVLRKRGLRVEREVRIIVYLDDVPIAWQRMDMLVEDVVLVENKAKRSLPVEATEQLTDYLKATRKELGLILNFGLRPEFKRLIRSRDRH
jgi:GxxExxY protein